MRKTLDEDWKVSVLNRNPELKLQDSPTSAIADTWIWPFQPWYPFNRYYMSMRFHKLCHKNNNKVMKLVPYGNKTPCTEWWFRTHSSLGFFWNSTIFNIFSLKANYSQIKNHKPNVSYLNPFLSLKISIFPKTFQNRNISSNFGSKSSLHFEQRVCRTVYPSPCLHIGDMSTDTPYVSHHLCFNLWNSIHQKNLQFFCSSSDMFQVLFSSQDNLFFDGVLLSYNCELHFALSYLDKTMRILFFVLF